MQDFSTFINLVWASVGVGCGIFLGFWQWKSIQSLGKADEGKLLSRLYGFSAIRILAISAIALYAFYHELRLGLIFLGAFFFGRWSWTLYTINQAKKNKE